MGGRTGKMTAAEIKRRGPRFVLMANYGLDIIREDKIQQSCHFLAKSYSLRYLNRLRNRIIISNREK